MKPIAQIFAAISVIVSTGCVSLLPETAPPKPRYHIQAVDSSELEGSRLSWSLVIEDPRATRVYDTVKIAVSSAPGRIEYYSGAEWADRAPRLFQTAVVESFEDSGRILSVGDRSAIPVGDVALQMDIRRIQLNVRGGEEIPTVSVFARLTDGKGKVHASRLFTASNEAQSSDADAVLSAFNSAFQTVISEIVAWTYEQGEGATANS